MSEQASELRGMIRKKISRGEFFYELRFDIWIFNSVSSDFVENFSLLIADSKTSGLIPRNRRAKTFLFSLAAKARRKEANKFFCFCFG
jgi:hypothetical protein